DAAPARVTEALELFDALAVPGDEVEEHPFAQRPGARHQLLGADALEDEIGEYGAGDDRVDTFRIEPLDAQPLAAVRLAQRPADPGDFLRGGDDVMQMTLGGFAALIPGNGHQVEHGSRGSHHAAYVAGGETREHRI